MKKEDKNKRTGNAYTYSNDEIRACMSEIRLLIAEEGENISDSEALQIIEDHVFSLKKSQVCGHKANTELIDRIFLSLRREMDILQPYIDDSSISEIMVNGRSDVFAERHGRMDRLPVEFDTVEDLEELIRRIASRVHREINELNPIVDARLSDGSRVNAVYKNIALNGPILTIRKFPDTVMTMDDLISNGTVEEETASFLEKLVKAGYNCFICGGTSSGKTTLLNVLSQSIPPGERLVVIEEQVENIVRLECRNANVQGKGGIDMSQLVKASLRMRPDRIIVGEVRGKEVMDMIQALNTGHSGMSTGHANSIDGMLKRLEAMFLQAADFPVEAIRRQITAGIEIMIHMSRMKDGSRKITEIAELTGMEGGNIKVNMLYSHERGRTENALENREKLELAGMTESSGQNR